MVLSVPVPLYYITYIKEIFITGPLYTFGKNNINCHNAIMCYCCNGIGIGNGNKSLVWIMEVFIRSDYGNVIWVGYDIERHW